MKNKFVYNLFFLISSLLLFFSVSHATAGTGTILASPSSGTKLINEEFNVIVRVTGSANFTVFKSSVSLSNLSIVSFTDTAGDVIWTTEPSSSSLGFNGAIKGATGQSSIDVYTIRVKGTSAGSAGINLSSGRIVATASTPYDLTVGYTNGSYTIVAPTSTPVPTVAPTHTNVPNATHTPTRTPSPTHTPTPTPIPNCTPVCTGKTCGDDGCNGSCGTCLSGYSCSTVFACEQDPNLTEDQFQSQWDGIESIGEVGLQLGFDPASVVLGSDGNSLGNFRFFGTTAPNVDLNIYVFSTPIIKSTTSDALGNWSVTITEPLAAGTHHAYAVMVTNGIETKNSEIVAFDVNPVTKVVALSDSVKVTPTLTTAPVTTDTSSIMPLALLVLAFVIILGFLFVYKRSKKQSHTKKEMVREPIGSLRETEE